MDNNTPNPNNFLNWVEIKNFKSIKDLRLDCKRVNVFIGKPNVGKSNILEGLGVLGAGYNTGKFLKGAVRYSDIKQLFWDNDSSGNIKISTNRRQATITRFPTLNVRVGQGEDARVIEGRIRFAITGDDKALLEVDELGQPQSPPSNDAEQRDRYTERRNKFKDQFRVVKKYDFGNLTQFESPFHDFLLPPNGSNLYSVIRRSDDLWSEFAKLFDEQRLELVLYDEKQEFLLQKKVGPRIWQYPFFSIADTFRRFMFYITAIESNTNSVIVFEEPEVHSFPPYVKTMAHRIVDSEENQFFISTHSPYLLQTLIRELDESQLSVFITYYKDYQTCVRQLTVEELKEAEDLSIDLFYNLSRYEPNA